MRRAHTGERERASERVYVGACARVYACMSACVECDGKYGVDVTNEWPRRKNI